MPSLRERVGSWISGRATEAIPFYPSAASWFGPGIANQPSHETLLREALGVADTAIRAIANRLSTLDPLVKVSRRLADGTLEDEILDDHPLAMLLGRPHPNLTMRQLLRLTGQYIVTVGEAYWLKVGNGLAVPTELHPMPPGQVRPRTVNNVVVEYWVTDGNGQQRAIPAGDVIRFFFPDPENIWGSEGYLGPSGIVLDSQKFASEHLRQHYQNDATPPSVLETGENATAFKPGEQRRFLQQWRESYHSRMGKDQGGPGILPMGYKLIQMAIQSGADIQPLLEYWSDELLMAFGTPKSILGKVVSGDRSSAETNQFVFDKHTIAPIASLIEDGLTMQLAGDFDPGLFVQFALFVSDDKKFTLEQETADLTGKVRSINQVRTDRGLDEVEWGEEPVGKIGEAPYDPDAFAFESDVEGALGDFEPEPEPELEPELEEEPEEEPDRAPLVVDRAARAAHFTPELEWLRQVEREKAFVPTMRRAMLKVLQTQKRTVLARLNKTTAPRTRIVAEELFGLQEWSKLFAREIDTVRERAFQVIMQQTLNGFGIEDFDFTFTQQKVLRRQAAQLVTNANKTTQGKIRRQLEVATGKGESIDQIAKRIRSVFTVRRNQARTIARTEVLKASQQAQLESFAIAEVDEQQWNTSLDAAVRESHGGASGGRINGQRRPPGIPFELDDGEAADAPGIGAGGSTLSAGNSINCRCFLSPVV